MLRAQAEWQKAGRLSVFTQREAGNFTVDKAPSVEPTAATWDFTTPVYTLGTDDDKAGWHKGTDATEKTTELTDVTTTWSYYTDGTTKLISKTKEANNKISMDVNSLTADINVTSSEGDSVLAICKETTGKGIKSTVYESAEKTKSANASGTPVYKSNKSYPIMMKYDGIKIPSVAGNVKITVEWGVTSTKNYVDRKLQIIAGDTTKEYDIKISSKPADNAELTVDLGEEGDTVYIASTNEVYINKITIKPAE